MNRWHLAAITASVVAALHAVPAVAQSQSHIGRAVTDGAQIEAAIARGEAPVVGEEDDQEIDGEAGVYVLRKADIFFVGGEVVDLLGHLGLKRGVRILDQHLINDVSLQNFTLFKGLLAKLDIFQSPHDHSTVRSLHKTEVIDSGIGG